MSADAMTLATALAVLVATTCLAHAATPSLRVSDNGRFLVQADGRPFFWLGDTAWELFHRLDREQAEVYLQHRARHGYTVVQAVALAELDGLTAPNPYGQLPLVDHDPARPNDAYFTHVDWIVRRANELGLVIGFLPTWGDKWNKKWGVGPEIFTPENAEAFGLWVGRRYKDAGLVWILGGDRPVENDRHRAIIEAMARGLILGDGGAHLVTFHPTGGAGSSERFHEVPWLHFNMRQNGHQVEFTGRYDKTRADYDRVPVKPVLDAEPVYEDHPVSFKPDELGHTVGADVRRPLYWNLFSGAFGHTYGHHSVWQMAAAGRAPINRPLMPWSQALGQPGALQMRHGRALMESRPFLTRIPDPDVIVADPVESIMPGAGRYRFVATRDAGGAYAMVYAPVGRAFSVRLDKVSGSRVRAWWFNPRTGTSTLIDETDNPGGMRRFVPPDAGEHLDWILVLDDVSKGFAAPGTPSR
jgi:hypothetical protein